MRGAQSFSEIKATQILSELFELAARYKVRIPSEYAIIGRASALIEGIIRKLDPNLEVVDTLQPLLKRLITERTQIPKLTNEALKSLLHAGGLMRDLPIMTSQILMDLEAGKIRVQIDSPELAHISKSIESLGLTLFMGLVACGLVVGAVLGLNQMPLQLWGLPIVPVLSLYAASLLLGVAVGKYFLAPRIKKISLNWLINYFRKS